MSVAFTKKPSLNIERLNEDIQLFKHVHPITPDMKLTQKGVSRLVMIDRYAYKDTEKITLSVGDFVVLTIKEDPKFPARGLGFIKSIDWEEKMLKLSSRKNSLLRWKTRKRGKQESLSARSTSLRSR